MVAGPVRVKPVKTLYLVYGRHDFARWHVVLTGDHT